MAFVFFLVPVIWVGHAKSAADALEDSQSILGGFSRAFSTSRYHYGAGGRVARIGDLGRALVRGRHNMPDVADDLE